MGHQFWLIFRNTTKARETCTAVTWSSVLQALCSATLQRCAASIVSSQACTCKAESLCLVLVKMLVTWMHDFELPGLARLRKTLQSTSCMHWNKECCKSPCATRQSYQASPSVASRFLDSLFLQPKDTRAKMRECCKCLAWKWKVPIFLSKCRVFATTIQLASRLRSCRCQHTKRASGTDMGPNIGHNIICLRLPLRIFWAVVLKSLALSCTSSSSCLTPINDGSNPCSCKSCHIHTRIQRSGPCCLLHWEHTGLLANRFLGCMGTDLLDSGSKQQQCESKLWLFKMWTSAAMHFAFKIGDFHGPRFKLIRPWEISLDNLCLNWNTFETCVYFARPSANLQTSRLRRKRCITAFPAAVLLRTTAYIKPSLDAHFIASKQDFVA